MTSHTPHLKAEATTQKASGADIVGVQKAVVQEQAKLALTKRIDETLERAVAAASGTGHPPLLAQAMRSALFPGGARVRPRLTLAVALACGDRHPHAANAAAASIELLHCASLVHDDMPCFDDADMRRGKPSVHKAFSEPLALLTGDALIVLAFETLARECADVPAVMAGLITTVAQSVGMPMGIVAGQAWESEATIDCVHYHKAKTASLFMGATAAGAIASGANPEDWVGLGEQLGAAYQVADDLGDYAGTDAELGKPAGQDLALDRPNIVQERGIKGALEQLQLNIDAAVDAVPACPGDELLKQLIQGEAKRLVPASLAQSAA